MSPSRAHPPRSHRHCPGRRRQPRRAIWSTLDPLASPQNAWCRVVGKVATINIGSALDQEPHGGMVPAQEGQVQRRGLLNPASPCVNELGVRIEMLTKLGEISGLRRPDDGGYHLGLTVGAGQILLAIARQQLNGRMALVLSDLVDGAAIRVRG